MDTLCKLTLVYPPGAADTLVELLLRVRPPIGGFTTLAAEGHGFGFKKATVSERVRGRVDRQMLIAVLARTEADTLLETIRETSPVPHLVYWIEPVLAGGRLVHEDSAEPGPM